MLHSKNIVKVVLVLSLVCCSLSVDNFFTKVIHNTDPDAKCLDGSSPFVYLHQGGDTKNILLYFLGGGFCMGNDLASTLEQCYKRSKGEFGTSTIWPDKLEGDLLDGILDFNPVHSKFANWTKIIFMYCDGAFHQGNNRGPIQYKDTQLYFRGAVNTRSHLKWVESKYALSKAEKVIVSGSSAGGIATYLWVDHIRTLVSDPKVVSGVVDSGIFFDPYSSLQAEIVKTEDKDQPFKVIKSNLLTETADSIPVKILMQLSNVDERPPNKECTSLMSKEDDWKCTFIQFSYPTLRFPVLFVQSSYDQYMISKQMKIKCLKQGVSGFTLSNCSTIQMNDIEAYRSLYLEKLLPGLIKQGHSAWSISCSWHSGMFMTKIYDSDLQKVPKGDGPTMRTVVEEFVFEGKRAIAIDQVAWPGNTPCAY